MRKLAVLGRVTVALGLASLAGAGCGLGPGGGGDVDCDKCDGMNESNDPASLGFTIRYELADESMVGQTLRSDLIPYSPPTYFPFTSDGINARRGDASPAERYDMAFSGWEPPEGFFELDRLTSSSDRQFDQAYYDALGPVATWEHMEHGLGRLHDEVDNDGDGLVDFDDDDNEGLEGWFGYCNGNTAAALSVPAPLHDVTVNDVTFTPYDIMALMAAVHYGDRSTVTGLRCNASRPAVDEYGRYIDQPWLRRTGEGADDALVLFEVLQGPAYYDSSRETVAYLIGIEEGDETRRAVIRLPFEEFARYGEDRKAGEVTFDDETWEAIEFSVVARGCRDTNPATLYLAVTHLLGIYRIPFGIDADAGSHVWNYPIYEARINEQRRVELAEANGLLGVEDEEAYPFNDEAEGFAYVSLDLTRSHSLHLEMVLELDDEDRVIGGEWVGGSRTRHPDFIWIPMGADTTGFNTAGVYMTFGDDQLDGEVQGDQTVYNDAPGLRYSDVRRLLAASRTEEGETFATYDGQGSGLAAGETTELAVAVEAETDLEVREALVYLDAEAEFVPGLRISIVSPTGVEVDLLDVPYSNQEWAPGRFPTGWDLGVVRGVAHPMPLVDQEGQVYPGLAALEGEAATGEWTLRVENVEGGEAQLHGWSLWLTTAPTE